MWNHEALTKLVHDWNAWATEVRPWMNADMEQLERLDHLQELSRLLETDGVEALLSKLASKHPRKPRPHRSRTVLEGTTHLGGWHMQQFPSPVVVARFHTTMLVGASLHDLKYLTNLSEEVVPKASGWVVAPEGQWFHTVQFHLRPNQDPVAITLAYCVEGTRMAGLHPKPIEDGWTGPAAEAAFDVMRETYGT